MSKSIKKLGTVMLSGAMLFPAVGAVMNQTSFAGELDKTIGVSAIKQLPNWCWIDSGYMMLRKYLEDNGKLLSDESIYERYGDECVREAEIWPEEYKSKEEFEQLYKGIFIDKTILGESSIIDNYEDNLAYKDEAFLVYLSTDLLNKNNYQEIFIGYDDCTVMRAVNIALRATGLEDKICVEFDIYGDRIDWKFGVINYALNKNSSVVSFGGGHVKVINGIEDDKVCVQETNGEAAERLDANEYLKYQKALLFISDVNVGRNGDRLEGIWSVNPNKNQNDVTYNNGETISVFLNLNKNINKIYLINRNKKILFTKTSDYVLVEHGVNINQFYQYVATISENVSLRDLIGNYHFDENYRPEEDRGSSSGGGSSSSWSSMNYNTTSNINKKEDDVNKTTNNITNLVTYEYNADNVKAISAEDAIKTYLPTDINLTNVKDNKTIIFKTNKYDNNNNKENLAIWTFELVNLNRDFAKVYNQLQSYETKEKTGALNEEEKGKIQELKAQMKGYNFKLNIKNTSVEDAAVPDKIKEIFKGKNSILVDFSEGGTFPGEATVDVNLGKDKANQEYIVYYLNIVNGNKKVQLLSTDIKATSNGYVRFRSGHGADYIFLPKTAENLANAQQIAVAIENSIK